MEIGTETPLRWGKQDVFFLWEKNQSVAKTTLCILSLRRISEQPLGGCSLCTFERKIEHGFCTDQRIVYLCKKCKKWGKNVLIIYAPPWLKCTAFDALGRFKKNNKIFFKFKSKRQSLDLAKWIDN